MDRNSQNYNVGTKNLIYTFLYPNFKYETFDSTKLHILKAFEITSNASAMLPYYPINPIKQ